MTAQLPLRIASILLWVNGIGLGLPCVIAIRNLLTGGDIPMILGFPAYGRGPFEHYGIPTTVGLLGAFLVVCTLESAAGWLLWGGHRSGAILALALLPLGAVFWWGFALPIPPLFALVRTILILLNWTSSGSTRRRRK
jgi:hypothetical protein